MEELLVNQADHDRGRPQDGFPWDERQGAATGCELAAWQGELVKTVPRSLQRLFGPAGTRDGQPLYKAQALQGAK